MLLLNGFEVTAKHFADGTTDVKIPIQWIADHPSHVLEWRFDSNEEMVLLYFLTKHVRSKSPDPIRLVLPYIPNARKDRAHRQEDVFTLKYFSEFINSLQFASVTVLDPHSNVSEALIDRIRIVRSEATVKALIASIGENTLAFYPDEGAVKRYADGIGASYVYGMKMRDKTTRRILHFDVFGEVESLPGANVLMIDDICASGKTLYIAAQKLKELGAGKLYVYVSHCENQAVDSELLSSGIIEKLYTTYSILRASHPLISVVDVPGVE